MKTAHHTRFTALLGCELPIQLAPMAGPVTAELAAEVADAGAHACVPLVMMPASAVAAQLDELRVRTNAVAANFIVPLLDPEALDAAIERAPLVDFHAGPPDAALVERVHAGGALASWQVGSTEQALAAQDAGCDLIVAQGVEAGGRLMGETPLAELLPAVAECASVPVVAAGGIATADDVFAAINSGADAVRVGTRFIASEESGAHPAWIDALRGAGPDATVVTDRFRRGLPPLTRDRPHRVLRSSLEAAERIETEIVGEMRLGGRVQELERFAAPAPNRSFRGVVEATPFYAGSSAGAIRSVMPAAEIVAELCRGLEPRSRDLPHARTTAGAGS